MNSTPAPPPPRRSALALVWVGLPGFAAVVCLVLFAWVLIGRLAPPGARLLLEVAAVIGFIVGAGAVSSALGGAALLEEQSDNEPLRFQEAGWILGLPVGAAAGLLFLIFREPPLEASHFTAYGAPLMIIVAFCATLWAVLTRVLLRRETLTRDDYACAVFMPAAQYRPLARRKQAWRAARKLEALTLNEARALMPDIVQALAEKLERVQDEVSGNRVIQLLGDLGHEAVVPELIAALDSTRHQNRRVAAIALGKLAVPEAAPPLMARAAKDGEVGVRRAAVVALGKVGSSAAVPTLMEALGDAEAGVRASACVALGKLGAAEALPALEERRSDQNARVRESAARAVEEIGGAAAQVDSAEK